MMGNREIKITSVKTGCWKAGNGAGLQGWLAAEGSREREALTQGLFGENTQFSQVYGPTPNPRGRGSAALLAAGWCLVFPKT